MNERRHIRAGLFTAPGPDRKQFKGEPSVQQVPVQQTSNANPWQYQAPYLSGGSSRTVDAQGVRNENFEIPGIFQLARENFESQRPEYFPGQTIAGFNPTQQAAQTDILTRAQAGSPLLQAAQNTATGYASGDFSNPAANALSESIRRQVMPGIDSRFSAAGRSFSPAHAGAAAQGLTTAIAPYAFGAQQQALQQAPTLAAADYADLDRRAVVGGQQQQQSQAEINDAITRHNFGENKDYNKLLQYSGLLQGQFGGTNNTTGIQNVPFAGGSSKGSDIGSILGGGGTAALGAAALGF